MTRTSPRSHPEDTRRPGDLRYARTAALLLALMLLLAACSNPLAGLTQRGAAPNGGLDFTLKVSCPTAQPNCDVNTAMSNEMNVLRYRCQHGLGVSNPVVSRQGATTIVVELPANTDASRAITLLIKPGALDFIDTNGTQLAVGATPPAGKYAILLSGANLDPHAVQAEIDPQTNQPVVVFAFAGGAKDTFATYTRSHIGQYLTITLDGVVIESATIQSEIDGQAQITGLGNVAAAQDLAVKLQSRALPLPVTLVAESQVKSF